MAGMKNEKMKTADPGRAPVSQLRKEYTLAGLSEREADADPIEQFRKWLEQAIAADVPEPTAMTLATSTSSGKPSARIVLLKRYDRSGFVFFTNYGSRKGKELEQNPNAALVFHWVALERQVRIIGIATKVSREETEAYFHTRPVGSQIGALASNQSEVIPGRELLEKTAAMLGKKFEGKDIPVPETWGGFRILPTEIEFWQGRPNRLHDRLRYALRNDRAWTIERLSP